MTDRAEDHEQEITRIMAAIDEVVPVEALQVSFRQSSITELNAEFREAGLDPASALRATLKVVDARRELGL